MKDAAALSFAAETDALFRREAEPGYRVFLSALVPGKELYGVRIPRIRQLAASCRGELSTVWEALLRDRIPALEDQLFCGFVLARAKMPFSEKQNAFLELIRTFDNWAACDSVCAAMKDFRRYPQEGIRFADELLCGPEFSVRTGVVLHLSHYLKTEEYGEYSLKVLFGCCDGRLCNQFYAQMAVAWALAEAWIRKPQYKEEWFCRIRDPLIRAKTVQKALESKRLSLEQIQYLKQWKEEYRAK